MVGGDVIWTKVSPGVGDIFGVKDIAYSWNRLVFDWLLEFHL